MTTESIQKAQGRIIGVLVCFGPQTVPQLIEHPDVRASKARVLAAVALLAMCGDVAICPAGHVNAHPRFTEGG